MEKLIERTKSITSFVMVMAFLSLTWLIIDYFVMLSIIEEGLSKFSLEWILIIVSGIVYLIFTVSVFAMGYYSFRVVRKLNNTFYTVKPDKVNSEESIEQKDKNEE